MSVHSWEYLHYVDELLRRLGRDGERIPLVIGGAILTPSGRTMLLEKGVAGVFDAQATQRDIIEGIRRLAATPQERPEKEPWVGPHERPKRSTGPALRR